MKDGIHTKFILTPIFEILKECLNATKGIGDGIGSYPLCEYIMQTTFLKMTGASEQKLKCILWELATNDFEFRYEFLKNTNDYGECSSIKAKKKVFNDLAKEITELSSESDILKNLFDANVKKAIKTKATKGICDLLEDSVIIKWQEKKFSFFKRKYDSFFKEGSFCNYSNNNNKNKNENENKNNNKNENKNNLSLIEQSLNFESIVFNHRNRCAHNLMSYQTNLPRLFVLVDEDYDYQNYFFRFSILVLLDEIFIKMYNTYLNLLEKHT